MQLWKIHLQHINTCQKTSGKTRQTIFDPMLLKWAIVLLAKTPHAVYSKMSSLFLLLSLSYVLRKNEALDGKQESAIGGTQIAATQSMLRELIKKEILISRGCLAFDTMKLQDGTGWDIY